MVTKFLLIALFFLLIYSIVTFYVTYNGWIWLKKTFGFSSKKSYINSIILLSIAPILGKLNHFPTLEEIFVYIGWMWIMVILYGLLILPFINIIYYSIQKKGTVWLGIAVLLVYAFIFSYGTYNAWNPIIKTYNISVPKETKKKNLKIVMATDLHLGNTVKKEYLQKFVNISNHLRPDIVLFSGDIIDDYVEPFKEQNMGKTMKRINTKYGVFAVLGNHEYYGKEIPSFLKEMKKAHINILLDKTINIDNQFYLIGRKDITDKNRKTIKQLTKGFNQNKPIIMMDHQPKGYKEDERNGIDLVVSGHTHGGQIFPGNLLTHMIYENDWGYLKKGNLQTIVSSGYGLWDPPFRIGTRSEIVVINLHFK